MNVVQKPRLGHGTSFQSASQYINPKVHEFRMERTNLAEAAATFQRRFFGNTKDSGDPRRANYYAVGTSNFDAKLCM